MTNQLMEQDLTLFKGLNLGDFIYLDSPKYNSAHFGKYQSIGNTNFGSSDNPDIRNCFKYINILTFNKKNSHGLYLWETRVSTDNIRTVVELEEILKGDHILYVGKVKIIGAMIKDNNHNTSSVEYIISNME